MKKLLLKTMLLLFALVAGSTSSWAADVYERITATSELIAGEQYILVCETQGKVMGSISTTSTTYGISVSATITSNTITATSDMNILTLGGNSDGWTFRTSKESKYLSWSSGNSLAVVSSGPNNSEKWTISFSSNNAVIANKGTDARKIVYNASSPRFACYTSAQTAIQIYKKLPSYTVTAQSNNATYGTVSIDGMKITGSPNEGCRYATPAYTVIPETAATVSQDGNTFTVTPSSDCTITINFEAIPAHTLSSAVLPVAAAGTVTLGSTSVSEGSTTTATAAANPGYKFKGWSISDTGASLSSTTDNPTVVTMGMADATVTATFEAAETHEISWSVNGVIVKTDNVEDGAAIDFASPASGIPNGYAFQGWVTEAINTPTDIAPNNYVTEATSDADITYYAVMAIVKSSTPASWTEASLASLTASDIFVFSNGTYAMNNDGGTSDSPTVNSITVSDGKITSEVADNLKWQVSGNDEDGYTFYPNGSTTTWMYCNTTAGSKSNNNIRVGTGDRKVWIFDTNGYLVTNDTYTDRYLSIFENQDFRGYTTKGSAFVPKFYKYVPSSSVCEGYCTSAKVSVTVTSANYATYVSDFDLDFTGKGIKAYIAKADGTTGVTFEQVKKVPANTGVLLYKDGGTTEEIPVLSGDADDVTGNVFKPGAGATVASVEGDLHNYILNNVDGVVGFYKANGQTVGTNRAYIQIDESTPVKGFIALPGSDEETGIETMRDGENEKMSAIFDLSGRRVAKPTRGLYIVNGKKVLVK